MSFNDLEQGYGVSTSQRNRPQQQGKEKRKSRQRE